MPPHAAADPATRLSPTAAVAIRAAIRLAGGREVCFAATLDDEGVVVTVKTVARGDSTSVLALPGFAQRGQMLIHNHPSGNLDPSHPDLEVAARIHDDGIGFAIVDNDATELYVVVEVPDERMTAGALEGHLRHAKELLMLQFLVAEPEQRAEM